MLEEVTGKRVRKQSARASEAAKNAQELDERVFKARLGKGEDDDDYTEAGGEVPKKKAKKSPAKAKQDPLHGLDAGEAIEVCFVRQGKSSWRAGTTVTVDTKALSARIDFAKSEGFAEGRRTVDLSALKWRRPEAAAAAEATLYALDVTRTRGFDATFLRRSSAPVEAALDAHKEAADKESAKAKAAAAEPAAAAPAASKAFQCRPRRRTMPN